MLLHCSERGRECIMRLLTCRHFFVDYPLPGQGFADDGLTKTLEPKEMWLTKRQASQEESHLVCMPCNGCLCSLVTSGCIVSLLVFLLICLHCLSGYSSLKSWLLLISACVRVSMPVRWHGHRHPTAERNCAQKACCQPWALEAWQSPVARERHVERESLPAVYGRSCVKEAGHEHRSLWQWFLHLSLCWWL